MVTESNPEAAGANRFGTSLPVTSPLPEVPSEVPPQASIGQQGDAVAPIVAPGEPKKRRSLSTFPGFLIILFATGISAFAQMATAGALNWITGVVFTAASVVVALLIRRRDLSTAVISPPLAFAIAVVASIQPWIIGEKGNIVLLEGAALFTSIAFNAVWMFVGTGAALVIVLVRRSRFRKADQAAHAAPE